MKKAVLIVSFGVGSKAYRETMVSTFEQNILASVADYDVFRAYTSKRLIEKIAEREGVLIDNPEQALAKLHQAGYEQVLVVPLYVISGVEYAKLSAACEQFAHLFQSCNLLPPLLSAAQELENVAQALISQLPTLAPNQAAVFVGHGTTTDTNCVYPALERVLQELNPQVFVGELLDETSVNAVTDKLKAQQITSVVLIPLLFTLGRHAQVDIAGDEPSSWKTVLTQQGFALTCHLKPMVENPAVARLLAEQVSGTDQRTYTVGTRGSKLALAQTQQVIDELSRAHPNLNFAIKIIETKGDAIQDRPLNEIGGSGLFVKEIEHQLLNYGIDLAVHSMKDLPSVIQSGLKLVATPKRQDPRDVLILKEPANTLADLPHGAKIGTGSPRRKYQLLQHRPDLQIEPIRGNIDTRINKIQTQGLDGIVLAAAGLARTGMSERASLVLPTGTMLPAPAQGALALQIRTSDSFLETLLMAVADASTQVQIAAERGFLEGIGGSCHLPVGAFCQVHGDSLILTGMAGTAHGENLVTQTISQTYDAPLTCEQARELGLALANTIKQQTGTLE